MINISLILNKKLPLSIANLKLLFTDLYITHTHIYIYIYIYIYFYLNFLENARHIHNLSRLSLSVIVDSS